MAANKSGTVCYCFNFITEPDDALKCLICLEVAEEPWQHGRCGRLFCKQCLETFGSDKPCPNCRMEQPQYFEDSRSKRDIKALSVKCTSVDSGCEWEGTVATQEKHLATCKFALVPCPMECETDQGTVQYFMRKDLTNHLDIECPNREYECEHCGEKGTYANITQIHDEECEKKIIPCPNADCTDTIQRQDIKRHLENCVHTEIPCKYEKLGCDVKMGRDALSAHEDDDKLHLHMAFDKIVSMEAKIDHLEIDTKIKQMEVKMCENYITNGGSLTFKLSEFEDLKKQIVPFYSPTFYSNAQGYHMRILVAVYEDTHISIYVEIQEGQYDNKLDWPFRGTVTFELLNQLENRKHHRVTMPLKDEHDMIVDSSLGYSEFIAHSALDYDRVKKTQYLKDDTLYFRVSVKVKRHKPWLECRAR